MLITHDMGVIAEAADRVAVMYAGRLAELGPVRDVLTLVQLTLPMDARDYVNSMWEHQKDPYGGDVINAYNDGPPEPGAKPLGPFYELETSSPAAALAPGESLLHRCFFCPLSVSLTARFCSRQTPRTNAWKSFVENFSSCPWVIFGGQSQFFRGQPGT